MNLLNALLVSITWDGEVGMDDYYLPDNNKTSDNDLRKQYPTLQDAWDAKQDALEKYKTLLKLIRATNP